MRTWSTGSHALTVYVPSKLNEIVTRWPIAYSYSKTSSACRKRRSIRRILNIYISIDQPINHHLFRTLGTCHMPLSVNNQNVAQKGKKVKKKRKKKRKERKRKKKNTCVLVITHVGLRMNPQNYCVCPAVRCLTWSRRKLNFFTPINRPRADRNL